MIPLTIDENNVNKSIENFRSKINNLLDKCMPLKKSSNREFKRTYKPWIINGILKSINRKDKLNNKYVKTKNISTKDKLHKEYKILWNQLNEIIRLSNKKKLLWEIFCRTF